MCGECKVETYVICKIDSQRNRWFVSGNPNRGSVSTERGGVGRVVGGRFKREGT